MGCIGIPSIKYSKLDKDDTLTIKVTDTDEYKFVAVFRPYLEYIEELKDLYKNKELDIKTFNPTTLTNIFYYDYDKSNKTVSKLVKRLKYPFLIKQINLIIFLKTTLKLTIELSLKI